MFGVDRCSVHQRRWALLSVGCALARPGSAHRCGLVCTERSEEPLSRRFQATERAWCPSDNTKPSRCRMLRAGLPVEGAAAQRLVRTIWMHVHVNAATMPPTSFIRTGSWRDATSWSIVGRRHSTSFFLTKTEGAPKGHSTMPSRKAVGKLRHVSSIGPN